MPTSNQLDDSCVCTQSIISDPREKATKNDANRLKKLEIEVCRLRREVDKIKCQKAKMGSAIERAIIRGEAALGGRYKIFVPHEPSVNRDTGEAQRINDGAERSITSSSKSDTNGTDNDIEINSNNEKGKAKTCGQYILG